MDSTYHQIGELERLIGAGLKAETLVEARGLVVFRIHEDPGTTHRLGGAPGAIECIGQQQGTFSAAAAGSAAGAVKVRAVVTDHVQRCCYRPIGA